VEGDSVFFACKAQYLLLHELIDIFGAAGMGIVCSYDGTFPDFSTLLELSVGFTRLDELTKAWTRSSAPIAFCFAAPSEKAGRGGERAALVEPLVVETSRAYAKFVNESGLVDHPVPDDYLVKKV